MNHDEAKQFALNALADLPSGPPGEEVLAVLLAEAWEMGAVAGWKQSGEGFNAEYPDESTGGCSVDLTSNPYKRGAGPVLERAGTGGEERTHLGPCADSRTILATCTGCGL